MFTDKPKELDNADCDVEAAVEYDYQGLIDCVPLLAEEFNRCLKTVASLPSEAFKKDQRYWLEKLIGDYTDYKGIALRIENGLVDTKAALLIELECEMRKKLMDTIRQPPKCKRRGWK